MICEKCGMAKHAWQAALKHECARCHKIATKLEQRDIFPIVYMAGIVCFTIAAIFVVSTQA